MALTIRLAGPMPQPTIDAAPAAYWASWAACLPTNRAYALLAATRLVRDAASVHSSTAVRPAAARHAAACPREQGYGVRRQVLATVVLLAHARLVWAASCCKVCSACTNAFNRRCLAQSGLLVQTTPASVTARQQGNSSSPSSSGMSRCAASWYSVGPATGRRYLLSGPGAETLKARRQENHLASSVPSSGLIKALYGREADIGQRLRQHLRARGRWERCGAGAARNTPRRKRAKAKRSGNQAGASIS